MIDESVEHLPVVSEGKLIGICTRTDLLKVRQRQLQHEQRDPGAGAAHVVAEITSPEPTTSSVRATVSNRNLDLQT